MTVDIDDSETAPDKEDTLYYWAKRYVRSMEYAEEHPGAHDGDELEYCEDNMRRHLN